MPSATMTMRGFAIGVALAAALSTANAFAGSLTVRVVDSDGKPVADAVVSLRPQGTAAVPMRIGSGYRVEQRNVKFQPIVSVVPVGATVAFPNLDPFKHHVYSFSPAKRFELKLFARNETRSVTVDRAGIIAIGCNIHDSMSAYIYVTDTSWSTMTSVGGQAAFRDTPPRNFSLSVWHPLLRAPGNTVSSVVSASGQDRSHTMTVRLRPVMRHGSHGY